ncbi:UPF0225 protein YchJ [Microbulbifer aestuariivivens]|uniref:UPF0225 protein YchJ n=1 Tax=Microbulbifer aestuariivivens TaxID=1908308 RepID=A0ABP9WMJ9_9GAMM
MTESPCPCSSGKPFERCCGLYLSGEAYPRTAEALMRSRYTAYVMGKLPYLRQTWHPDTRPELNAEDLNTQWCRLEVVRSKQGLKRSIVEFRAWFRDAHDHGDGESDSERALHEISLFKLYKKRWVYVESLLEWP